MKISTLTLSSAPLCKMGNNCRIQSDMISLKGETQYMYQSGLETGIIEDKLMDYSQRHK